MSSYSDHSRLLFPSFSVHVHIVGLLPLLLFRHLEELCIPFRILDTVVDFCVLSVISGPCKIFICIKMYT